MNGDGLPRSWMRTLNNYGSSCEAAKESNEIHPCVRIGKTQVSRTTSAGFLSSRMAAKEQCRKYPAAVHSTNATWQTNFGVIQRHSFILSAVRDSPPSARPFLGHL